MSEQRPSKQPANEVAMRKHFVTFYSPGTFVAETSSKEIDSWDVEKAKKMAADITERYGAKPYGFRFSTRSRGANDLDSAVTNTSGMYYLNGRVVTLDEVKARNNPKEHILIANMEGNGWDRIVEKRPDAPGWMWTQPLTAADTVLP